MPDDAYLKHISLRPGETGREIIASFTPAGDIRPITPDDLMRAIETAGFGGYRIHRQALEDATARYNTGDTFDIKVADALDGEFSIRLDADLMAAYLNCTLPLGGAPVQLESILLEAERKGISIALDLEAIDEALRAGGNDIPIARGRAPVAGEDGRLESLVPTMKSRSPHLDAHGLADFRDLGEIVTVRAGDALMRLIPPTDGTPGETVTGKILPVRPGKKVAFAPKLDGVIPDPNDPDMLIAAISGCPSILKNGVSVEPVYSVKDVDLHTGNIAFDGTVHVSGDVHAGMSIKASGDIYVDGTVGNAMLEAGGDIVVKCGVIGSSELHAGLHDTHPAAIKCNGSCTARFVQNIHISAGDGIFIHDLAMQSELTAGHQIVIGDQGSRKGDIIGGVARATMLVKAQHIGSTSDVKTIVIAGANQLLHEHYNDTIKSRAASEHKLADIIKLLELARANPGRIPPASVSAAEATRDALNAEIEIFREHETELHEKIDLAKDAQVIAEKHIFGGTEIHMGLHCFKTEEDKEGAVFHLDEEGALVVV